LGETKRGSPAIRTPPRDFDAIRIVRAIRSGIAIYSAASAAIGAASLAGMMLT
jgi:hypothetical protein